MQHFVLVGLLWQQPRKELEKRVVSADGSYVSIGDVFPTRSSSYIFRTTDQRRG